jgi:hypothetical protein
MQLVKEKQAVTVALNDLGESGIAKELTSALPLSINAIALLIGKATL